jgi:hypothetical protein
MTQIINDVLMIKFRAYKKIATDRKYPKCLNNMTTGILKTTSNHSDDKNDHPNISLYTSA